MTTNAEVMGAGFAEQLDQMHLRAMAAEEERDAVAKGLVDLRAEFRALADYFAEEGFTEFPRAVREILDRE